MNKKKEINLKYNNNFCNKEKKINLKYNNYVCNKQKLNVVIIKKIKNILHYK
jgi:hypothetical protein